MCSSCQVLWAFLTEGRKLPTQGQVIPGWVLRGLIPSELTLLPAGTGLQL